MTEVIDDFEGEQETLLPCSPGAEDPDDVDEADNDEAEISGDTATNANKREDSAFAKLEDTVRNASKGVTEGTDAEYRRFVCFQLSKSAHDDAPATVKWPDVWNFWSQRSSSRKAKPFSAPHPLRMHLY